MNKDMVELQVSNPNNTWRRLYTSNKHPFYYVPQMKRLKAQYPNLRVRIVSSNSKLLEMIP
jgi:hypothetical protein